MHSGERRTRISAKAINKTYTRMTWVKVLSVTALVAIAAFMLGPIICSPAEGSPSPTSTQIPFLLFLSLVQATDAAKLAGRWCFNTLAMSGAIMPLVEKVGPPLGSRPERSIA